MRVAIIGGTGFVGSHLSNAMLGVGHDVSSLVRNGSEEKVQDATRVQIVPGDIASKASLRELIKGCDAVIYNVGILRESPRQGVTFEATQYEGVVNAVDAALDVRVRRFLLMSANGVKVPGTTYQETKFRAEEYALRSGLDVTVFRPSVIFGDPHGKMEFATQLFREMVRPPVPAVSFFSGRDPKQGAVVMSPVHITDVAAAFLVALENVDSIGKIYALGGPETLTWKQMISRIAAATGRRKWFVPMPIGLMRVGATLFDWLPFFPVTRDQLTMLEEGNVADPGELTSLIGREALPFDVDNLGYLAG